VTVTVAPAITAPVASETIPEMLLVTDPHASAVARKTPRCNARVGDCGFVPPADEGLRFCGKNAIRIESTRY
jgi:hypothetical protein